VLSTHALQAGETLRVAATVRNTSQRAGDEVVQFYVKPPAGDGAPRLALKGVRRIHLAAGQSRRVEFALSAEQLKFVNERGERVLVPGSYAVYVGGGQPNGVHAPIGRFEIVAHTPARR
jgi:beta-glucosidase